jgi:hypothetical protein
MRKLICAIAFVLATHAFSQQVLAQVFYWDPHGSVPVLYFFTIDNGVARGERHIYTTGNLSRSLNFPFTWGRQGDLLTIRDTINGSTDQFRLGGYSAVLDIQPRTGIGQAVRWGPGPWYGCRSGQMPFLIRIAACPAPQKNRGLSE